MPSSSTSSSEGATLALSRRARRLARAGTQIALGALVAGVIFETLLAALGAAGLVLPSRDPTARAPGAAFSFAGAYFRFPDFRNHVQLNADAFHDGDRAAVPAPGVLRVAVWGDSLVEGFQVPRGDLFTATLQARLDPAAERVEILNLGHSGVRAAALTDPSTQRYLRERGVHALVVVWHGLMEAGHAQAGGGPGLLPAAVTGHRPAPSALRRWVVDGLGIHGPYLVATSLRRIAQTSVRRDRPADHFFRAHEVDAPGRAQAWTRLEALVDALGELEWPVLLAYAPTLAEVQAERSGASNTLSPLRVPLDVETLRRHARAQAARRGLLFVDLTEALAHPAGPTHFRSDKHWTAEGHHRVAAALAEPLAAFCGALSPRPPLRVAPTAAAEPAR